MTAVSELARQLRVRLEPGALAEPSSGKCMLADIHASGLAISAGFSDARLNSAKRSIDVVLSALGLLFALPLIVVIACVIKLSSRGTVFYHQRRIGLHGAHFTLHKFRSMHADAEAITGAVWATANDPRITPLGRVLRRSRLDEVPQLWNVLIGDMSLVGPRPERPELVAKLEEVIPWYALRHSVKPGLTGWAQVRYPYCASVQDAIEKHQYDLFYLSFFSLTLDFRILLATVTTVLHGTGAR